MELKRFENESKRSYVERLVRQRMIDKTISTEYEDLSELIFGEGNCFNSS
ncbi:MAG: hypothetical protein WCR97_06435 [Bacilli bacterium]